MDAPLDIPQFARDHFADAPLGDRRRSRRLVTLAQQLLARPQGTLPAKIPDPYQLEAAYRFFRTEDAKPDAIQAPHRRRTRLEIERTPGTVLVAHDGTELNFSGLDVPELGVLAGPKSRGFVAHNSLALDTSGRILGLLHQIVLAPRKAAPHATKSSRRHDPEKASVPWRDALEAIGPTPPGQRWIHLADRGADVTEFLDYADEHAMEYVVRIHHDRRVTVGGTDGVGTAKLRETLRNAEEWGRRTQRIEARPGRPARTATVAIAAVSLALEPPRQPRGRERGVPLPATAIRVWEVDAPAGVEPLEWLLATNVPTADAEAAWERADWYAKRWTVEEYHKGLKAGVGLEDLQLTTETGLRNAIALLSVVAVGLVMLRELSRRAETSAGPVLEWVPRAWVEVLAKWRGRELSTVKEWVWALARLGGHQNAAKLGDPGWQTLLRGWTRLQAMVDGWAIHQKCGGS